MELSERYKILKQPGIELFERYKLAVAEHRAEVELGAQRQKLFVVLNPLVAALIGNTSNLVVATAALTLAGVASNVGVLIVGRSHGRCQRTRDVMLGLARELGCEQDWQTTGGMREARGEPRSEGMRVVTLIQALLTFYYLFDVAAVYVLWW